ncbi:hypothetical protein M407DRAFT_244356 [Tulasnella calospora MUT 4182]|uniref:Yeast cell wall synthesis Kre9/Knh1-like N-terminal domain-containing protein n=1 Tax=Tulasnella calospora MUT 4182 TaxID=1051891 RepID=A0A0C3Q625_9AGAM|nr:hypothetical protein M407DRAFT_244356 [Tulasnella calospora MUT 4182]
MFALTSAIVLVLASKALADPAPLTPPTTNVGGDCVISWTPDATGKWTETNIQLMTGDNWNMVPITTIATVDTTSAAATTYTWTCPDVSPNAPIYFYQFSHAAEPANLAWTTRFTIAAADGSTTAAENQTQPDGTNVPWGIGQLADPSEAKPAPAYITGQGTTGSTSASASGSASASVTMSMSRSSSAASSTASASKIVTSAAAASKSASASTSSASSTATANGSGRVSAKGVAYAVGAVAAAGVLALA